MRTSVFAFGAISLAASLAIATPASASSVIDPCTNLTDGVASSCHFSGNINTNTKLNGNSYLDAQNAYNTYATGQGWSGDLNLTPLAEFDGTGTSNGITFNGANGSTGGTFTVGAGVDLEYYAVKSSNEFIIYEFTGGPGTYDWSTAGLLNAQGSPQGLSHIIFFGTNGGVPEPATWAMMLLGIGMIGAGARRRRQSQSRSLVLS
jgi:hypothetical protein